MSWYGDVAAPHGRRETRVTRMSRWRESVGRRAHWLGLVWGLAGVACAPARPPLTPPELGGDPWREVVTAHIVLQTDLDEDDAEEAAQRFEEIYSAVLQAGFPPEPEPTGVVRVVLFRRSADYQQFAPHRAVGYFVQGAWFDGPLPRIAVLSGPPEADTLVVFAHEITHSFVRFYYPQAPSGLNEGLAKFYESITLEGDSALVGYPPDRLRFRPGKEWGGAYVLRRWRYYVPTDEVPSLTTILDTPRETFRTQPFPTAAERRREGLRNYAAYASAWGAAHFLLTGPAPYRDAFERYLHTLGNARLDVATAFDASFAAVDADALERDFRASLTPSEWGLVRVTLAPPVLDVRSQRSLGSSEVHLLWALLGRGSPRGLEEAEAAVRQDPASAEARLGRARLLVQNKRHDEAATELREARRLAPSNTTVQFAELQLQASIQGSVRVSESTLDALSRSQSASILSGLSGVYASGDPAIALSLAQRAVVADPSYWLTYRALARALAASGSFADAARALRMAVNLLPDGADGGFYDAELRSYLEKARSPSAPRAPAASE